MLTHYIDIKGGGIRTKKRNERKKV